MTRSRLLVLAGVAVALVVLGPVLALLLVDTVQSPSPSHGGGVSPDAHESDPVAEPMRPEEIAWVYTPPPNAGARVDAYVLQAGTLGADAPLVDLEVRWEADLGADLTRQPPIAGPIAGAVVYVADDGTASAVQRVAIAPDADVEVLAELGEVVWAMAAAPDGSALYAALVDRADTQRDLGVVRVLLDGSGTVEPLMPPAALPGAEITRVAFIGFNVQLALSDDARHLVRRACAGSEGCVVEVISLENGITNRLPDEELVGMAAGTIVQRRCLELGCGLVATSLETGDSIVIGDDLVGTVLAHRGVPVLVRTETDSDERSSIVAIDLAAGRRQVLYRASRGAFAGVAVHSHLTLAVPAGFVHVTEAVPEDDPNGAVVEMRQRELLVSLDDGAVVEISPAPFRPPAGFDAQG